MKNKYPKIYFGPMSKNIVDVLLEKSITYPIGFIPSRRQIEFDGGYVNNWSSQKFYDYVKAKNSNALICRDHGGRLQGKEKDNGVDSLLFDASIGFDIIHIDPWKEFTSIEEVATETIKMISLCLQKNKNCKFEVGTEEAIHKYSHHELEEFLTILQKNLKNDFDSIVYAVVQFGTAIEGTKNVGEFDVARSIKMIEVCKKFNVLSKEHNGDYLSIEKIEERFKLGLDAINIAPEFGTLESTILIDSLINNLEMKKLERFFDICYRSNKWKKWIPSIDRFDQFGKICFYDYLICKVCGHYNFTNKEVVSWKKELGIDKEIKTKLNISFDELLKNIYKEKK